jgi:L-threonylcarbamoyladenylate synthase
MDVDLILDGGPSEVGIESTIVDLSRGHPVILRPGRITVEDITRVLQQTPDERDAAAPRAPGTHESHYAPRAAMKLLNRRAFTDELARHRGQRVAVLALEISVPRVAAAVTRVLPASAALYARDLYAKLRELDALGADLILVEAPPTTPQWSAIWDRLRRASHAHATGTRAERHSQPWRMETKKSEAAPDAATDDAGGVDSY